MEAMVGTEKDLTVARAVGCLWECMGLDFYRVWTIGAAEGEADR